MNPNTQIVLHLGEKVHGLNEVVRSFAGEADNDVVESEMARWAALIQAMRSRYQSLVYSRAIILRMREEPDCTGRWTWSQRVGTASMTSTMSRVKSRGMTGGETDAADTPDLADGGQQFGEARLSLPDRDSC